MSSGSASATLEPLISRLARSHGFSWVGTRLLVLIAVSGAGACVVAPYERETLARRDMSLAKSADLSAGEDHAHAYREGSSGGGEAKGGGCGCN